MPTKAPPKSKAAPARGGKGLAATLGKKVGPGKFKLPVIGWIAVGVAAVYFYSKFHSTTPTDTTTPATTTTPPTTPAAGASSGGGSTSPAPAPAPYSSGGGSTGGGGGVPTASTKSAASPPPPPRVTPYGGGSTGYGNLKTSVSTGAYTPSGSIHAGITHGKGNVPASSATSYKNASPPPPPKTSGAGTHFAQ